MRNVLVTGGAGFIGSHLVAALLQRGDKVRVLDNFCTGHQANLAAFGSDVEVLSGDVSDAEIAAKATQGIDVVFHQAALASVPRSLEFPLETHLACATGTLNMLDAARKAGVQRFVYAGSSSAYGNQPGDTKSEELVPSVLSPYAAAKLTGELYCEAFYHSYGMETVRIRYFNVFGPRQDPNNPYAAVIPLFVKAMRAGKQPTIFGDGLQSRDFTYVSNVVHGNLLAAEVPGVGGEVFNVATGKSQTLLDLISTLNELLGTNIEPIFQPPRAGDVKHSLADISAARQALGYEPQVDFKEGLRRLLEAE